MEPPDEVLVKLAREGKTESFARLVDRYPDAMVRATYHFVNDTEAAQDLAQETFIDAYRDLSHLKDPASFRAWLYGILHHKCSKHLSRLARDPVSLDEMDPLSAPHEDDPLTDVTLDALNHLPDDVRTLLAARYLQELSYEEIALALKTTVNNVQVRCSRAKSQLRALVAGSEIAVAAKKGGLR